MKITITLLVALAISAVLFMIFLGWQSRKGEAGGLLEGNLLPCERSPNCVCSEFPENAPHYVKPLTVGSENADAVMARATAVLESMEGKVTQADSRYLSAEFSSGVFGMVDDFELRLDDDGLLHLRSASRVGRYDWNVNLHRAEKFQQLFTEAGAGS